MTVPEEEYLRLIPASLCTRMHRHTRTLHIHVQAHALSLTRKVKKNRKKRKMEVLFWLMISGFSLWSPEPIVWTWRITVCHSRWPKIEGDYLLYDRQKKKKRDRRVSIHFKNMSFTESHLPRMYHDQCSTDHESSNHEPLNEFKIKTPTTGV